jgi:hypothetical protein
VAQVIALPDNHQEIHPEDSVVQAMAIPLLLLSLLDQVAVAGQADLAAAVAVVAPAEARS